MKKIILVLCLITIINRAFAAQDFRIVQDKQILIDLSNSLSKNLNEILKKIELLTQANLSLDDVPTIATLYLQLHEMNKALSPSAYYGGMQIIWDDPQNPNRKAIAFRPYPKTLGDKIADAKKERKNH